MIAKANLDLQDEVFNIQLISISYTCKTASIKGQLPRLAMCSHMGFDPCHTYIKTSANAHVTET